MQNSTEKIKTRAYDLFTERNSVVGHDVEDWLKAEKEISQIKNGRADNKDTLQKTPFVPTTHPFGTKVK